MITLQIWAYIVGPILAFLLGWLGRRWIYGETLKEANRERERILKEARDLSDQHQEMAKIEGQEELADERRAFEQRREQTFRQLKEREQICRDKEKKIEEREDIQREQTARIEEKQQQIANREQEFERRNEEMQQLIQEYNMRLERVSGLTKEEAKRILLSNLKNSVKFEAAEMINQIKTQARDQAEREAKKILSIAVERFAADHTSEKTVTEVQLSSDDFKGKIIGKDGKNINAFEKAAGIEVIVDDTPKRVLLSALSPIKREVARMAMEQLIAEEKFYPRRIEEIVQECRERFERHVLKEGESVCKELRLRGLHSEIVKLLGRLRFRTSYGQNVLHHSKEVAYLTGMMASELRLDERLARRAGLLHDIGKAVDHDREGAHPEIGVELATKYGEPEVVINSIASHHEDVEASSPISVLVAAADAISGSRPGARREDPGNYIKRLEKLEKIANTTPGVEESYAIRAGREVRVIANAKEVSDEKTDLLASEIAEKIESEVEYPGKVKVTVIREVQAVQYVKSKAKGGQRQAPS